MAELKNEFSWSKSRDETFRRCARQYFFHYYGSWGGWDKRADPRVRTLYVLKQLQTLPMWKGHTVHNCLHWILDTVRKKGAPPPEEDALRFLGKRMMVDFEDSGTGLYWEKPKDHCALREHEYDEDVSDDALQQFIQDSLAMVSAFYHSDIFAHIRQVPTAQWLQLEERTTFDLDGVKVFIQLDFALRDGEDVVIYDWKTGKADTESTREQLACYVFYAAGRWQASPDRIRAIEFNLGHNAIHEHRLSADDLARTRETIAAQAAELRKLHEAPEDHFPFTDRERICETCNFRRVCPKFQ